MVSNWLITTCRSTGAPVGTDARGHRLASSVYRATIHDKWGMVRPESTDTETMQGVDYTSADCEDYADAWCVDGARLSAKLAGEKPQFDTRFQYSTALIFVAGPNAGAQGYSEVSTTRRTLNTLMVDDYERFRGGVKCALHAGLLAMAQMGCDVALLAHVSAGIYAGPHRERLRHDYEQIVNEILTDPRQRPVPLGHYFERVILTLLW